MSGRHAELIAALRAHADDRLEPVTKLHGLVMAAANALEAADIETRKIAATIEKIWEAGEKKGFLRRPRTVIAP